MPENRGQLKKKFGFFKPHNREEGKKTKLCQKLRNGENVDISPPDTDLCDVCRVFLISDRFMGEEYYEKTGLPKNTYPFVLISNAVGCNLDCWFCYSHKLIDPEDYNDQDPALLTPKELSDCYICKMGTVTQNLDVPRDNVFSRFRVSGGEPLYSSEDTLKGEYDNSFDATVDYWIEFFKHLNENVGDLIENDKIRVLTPSGVKEKRREKSGKIEKPTWIVEENYKIPLRFDTNGLLFTDESRARDFIEKVFDLHKEKKLDNLYVLIDYSFKGANAKEYFLSQGKKLENEDSDELSVEDHPQYVGLENYYKIKDEFLEKDSTFDNAIGITVEMGIQNEKDRVYLYSEDSLDWQSMVDRFRNRFKEKFDTDFDFELSEVTNTIYCIGEGGSYPQTYLHRYNNPEYGACGVKIILRWGEDEISCPSDDSKGVRNLNKKRKELSDKDEDYILIFFPEESKQKTLTDLD